MSQVAIQITGAGEWVELDLSTPDSYTVLSNAVAAPSQIAQGKGGMIELIAIARDLDMWVNEEYLYMGDDTHNLLGEALWARRFGTQNPILGSIVLTGGTDEEGDTLGLSESAVASLKVLHSIFA